MRLPQRLEVEPEIQERSPLIVRWAWTEATYPVTVASSGFTWVAIGGALGIWLGLELIWWLLFLKVFEVLDYTPLVLSAPYLFLIVTFVATLVLSSITPRRQRSLTLSPDGLTLDRKTLRWREIREVLLTEDELIIRGSRGRGDLILRAPLRPSHLRAFADQINAVRPPRHPPPS